MPPSATSTRRSQAKRKRNATATATNDDADAAALAAAVAASLATAPAADATPATSTPATSTPAVIYIDDESDEIALEALSHVAVLADAADDASGANDEFWIAQLLDDITHAMLEAGDAAVRITWLNRVGADAAASATDGTAAAATDKDGDDDDGDNDEDGEGDEDVDTSAKRSKTTKAAVKSAASRYTYAYDDAIDVDAILCHVFGLECADGSLEITAASLQRIQRRLARAKAALADPDALGDDGDGDASDDEKPPSAARQRRQLAVKAERSSDGPGRTKRARTSSSGGSNRRKVASAGGAPKLSKRDAARIIPPRYTTVDIALHDDRESTGTHAFAPILNDVLAANREVIRAVLTQDYALLERVTETPDVYKHMSTLSANRSVDIRRTALQYAIEADDVKAVAQLLKANDATEPRKFATVPSSALPLHSTGAHTSSYSDYNRRAINASRGGKEGNNALLADAKLGNGVDFSSEKGFFWRHPRASLKMLTLFYPSGAWLSQHDVPHLIARVARAGNLPLLSKMVETLVRNGGWGFNDLHLRVLSSNDDALPVFRAVSVTKMAQQTKIQPLHFAALNPNSKYLTQLWETLEEKPEHSKDDGGFEPLHYAATCATSDNVRYLLENDRSLLAKTKQEKLTPLMCAIRTQREDNAIVMLDMAAAKSQELLTQVLSARGAHSYQAIHYAAKHGCVRVIERLLHHGVAVNALAGDKTSALCVAAQFGQFDAATTLLARGAKVNLGDKLDKTPLIFAVKNGHTRLAALLINHGANVNAYDTSENSVAHYAASYGWLSCVELLASAGAEFWSRNAWGFVPLICALLKQRTLCADYMLENDATGRFLDFRDREGCTMLFLQCQHSSNLAQIEYLVKKGLNPNIPNASGTYPLDVLIERAAPNKETFSVDAIKLLLAHGALAQYETPADPDAPAVHQPLHNAIRRQLPAITELLLTEGKADPAVREADGADAWLRAAYLGDQGDPFIRLLLTHHNATFGDASPIPFTSRLNGKSFFHVVAELYYFAAPTEMIAVDLVRECIARCPTVSEMMNTKYNESSPLMTLVGNERREYDVSECSLDVLKRVDTMYSDVVRLYATHTTDPEALVMYTTVANPKYKEPEDTSDDETATLAAASEDVDMDAAAASAEPKSFTYKFKNILHVASSRNLFTTARRAAPRWYGEDVLSVLLELFAFSSDELNFAATSSWDTPLTLAVKKQFTLGAKLLLERGANPDHSPQRCNHCSTIDKPVSTSHCGQHSSLVYTALIDAINNKDVETAKLLLASNASPACTDGQELLTPLHIVMSNGDVEMVKCLLERGADPATTDRTGDTPLLRAIKGGRSIPVKKPHEGEVSYSRNTTALTVASAGSSASSASAVSIIEVALTYDSVRATLRIGDEHGRTALYYAARNRDLPLLRALVRAHPDKQTCANVGDAFGRTPLHAAVNAVSMNADATFDVERFLLLAGADVNAVDAFGFSVLHFALFKVDLEWHATYDTRLGRSAMVEQKRAGTYESTKDAASRAYFGKIPSSESDPVETVSNLVAARGVNLLSLDLLQRTPIHMAAATGAFVCVSTLLSNLPSAASRQRVLEMKDASELTPLACAFLHLRQTTITTLIQSNASVADKLRLSSSSSKARSFFYHAVKHSLAGIYHLLLNAKFSRRQAVEDAVLCGEFQLASNLIIGLEISNDSHSLGACNASESETLLHFLARVDKPFNDLPRAIAWTLIENNVDVHHVNLKGNSAFHFAARNGNAHLMDFLLHHKCDINALNDAGETPLLYALRKERHRVDKCMGLIAYCLDVPSFDLHVKDRSGRNVLLLVLDLFIAQFARTDSVLFKTMATLLVRGAKPDLVFESGKHVWQDVFGAEAIVATDSAAQPPAAATPATPATATSETTTALTFIVYIAPVSMRYELLELFLTHNAKLTVRDGTGNSVLMHLVAKNLKPELKLALGVSCAAKNARAQKSEIKAAVAQQNRLGQTPLHVAVQALAYGALENHDVVELLVKSGARFDARNRQRESVVDCIKRQQSRTLFRFVRSTFPDVIDASVSEAAFFAGAAGGDNDDAMTDAPPAYEDDAAEYIAQCEAAGKFERTPVTPEVDDNCDVGSVSHVYCALDADTNEPLPGEFFHVLLTKVDVKNGRFGVNAFYRMQVVVDELQEIYILFTNWGRIGEEGKYQNTPFRTAADAVVEFKKVFRSKTGNVWDVRRTAFEKKPGKYNLVQRVDVHTEIAADVTEPFHVRVKSADGAEPAAFAPLATPQQPLPLTQMLYAITDIRHLQLAAAQSCAYSEPLPLAKRDELEAAIAKLREILDVLEQRVAVDAEIQALAGDISDDGTAKLQALSTQYSDLTEVVSEKSSRYYEVMPCDEASLDASIEAFERPEQVHKELARLKLLVEIAQTYKILLGAKLRQQAIHPLDYCRAALQVQFAPLCNDASQEKALLTTYFFQGIRKSDHRKYKVSNIFRVERHGERARLADLLAREPALAHKPTQLLWHGTRRTNLMGILAQGLRIAPPEAPHHGYSYGRGLYFADVAQKSLSYCDAAYVIEDTRVDAESGKDVTTRRRVQYMLLCQVALGETELADAARDKTAQFTDCSSVASVKAPGAHAPDMSKSVVSPDCDAVVPVGTVGEPGVAYPTDVAWAVERYEKYAGVRTTLDAAAIAFLEKFVATHASVEEEGEGSESPSGAVVEIDDNTKYHVLDRWNAYNSKLTVQVLKRPRAGASVAERGFDIALQCKVEVSSWRNVEHHTFHVRRYRNVLFDTLAANGYNSADNPSQACWSEHHSYNELIVYKEAQARIRYLVEVEFQRA